MKNSRKLLAVLLVLAMTLSLAGCGMFELKMARAAKKMEKLQSYRMDMDMDMGMSLSMLGQSMDLDLGMQGKSDVNTKPLKMKTDMTLSTLGEQVQMLSYTEKTDDGFVTYISPDGGDTWARQSIESEGLPELSMTDNFGLLFKLASRFEKSGTETVRGSEATVFSGSVEGEDLDALVKATGALDSVAETLGTEAGELDVNLADYGSIPATISIDNKSGYIVRYTMDMTEMMKNLMPVLMERVMANVAEEAGLEGLDLSMLGLEMEMSRVTLSVELYDFDAAEHIEIPEAAKDAVEISDLAA